MQKKKNTRKLKKEQLWRMTRAPVIYINYSFSKSLKKKRKKVYSTYYILHYYTL